MKNSLFILFGLSALIYAQPISVYAQTGDRLIEGAKLCTRHLQRYETEYGIPSHLLSAIASTESGRYHEGLQLNLPWPWTINADGKGYFFGTKEEAVAAAGKLFARGVESMDVGCMQVNLHHHPEAFSSISQAFDPENNVAYAASFLRSLYQADGSWKKAASNYHSKTPSLGSKYVGSVYGSWVKIVDKLRVARLSIPSSSVAAISQMKKETLSTAKAPLPATVSKYIKVSNKDRKRDNEIIVIRPEIRVVADSPAPEPMVVADASAPQNIPDNVLNAAPSAGEMTLVPQQTTTTSQDKPPQPVNAAEAKIIRLDNKLVDRRPVNAQNFQKTGPNFIFNN